MRHIVAILSGYFNPLHIGHIEYMKRAREISDNVIVIVNNDKQRELKGSKPFQNQDERMKIIESLRIVVPVWLTGWQLYQPVRLKTPDEMGLQKFNDIFED
jgi:cytidyltransferase-like protein